MAIDPSTLEWGYRTFLDGNSKDQKANYSFNFNSGGQEYTFIPESVVGKGVDTGDKNYVFPWFLNQDNLKTLGEKSQYIDLDGVSWYGDYLKDNVKSSTKGFLVPSGSLPGFDAAKIVPNNVKGIGNTNEGLAYILETPEGKVGQYLASDQKITTLSPGRSILGDIFGSFGDDLASSIMGGFDALNGLPPVVTAALSAANPVLGAAITGAKIGGAVGSGQLDLGDAATSIAAAVAGSQLGGEVGGATGSNVAGQIAGNTASGLLSGQDLGSSLTNAALNTGANAAASGLLNAANAPVAEPYVPPTDYSTGANYDLTQGQDVGGLGLQGQVGAFDPANPYSFNTNFGNSDSMGGGTGIQIPNQEGATLGSIGAAAETPTDNPNLVNPAGTGLLSGLIKSLFTGSQGTGNMATTDNNAALSSLFGGLLGGAGNLMQGSTNVEARQAQADALRAAGQQAATASQFRPVGTTTTFGTSNFQVDPTTGQLQSAGYQLSPQLQQYQNTLMAGGQQSLTDAANLQNLGRGYIAQSPEAAAQQYMTNQQALLAPSRDMESARLANQLQQTGRTGVSVAQGGNLGMANPEQQALANARAMQDLQLAAQAQQQGRAQTTFGQGLLTGAYDPFNAGLKSASTVEGLGQQPFGMSADLAAQVQRANAQGGALNLNAQTAAANAMLPANQYNPYASLLSGAAGNNQLTSAAGSLFGQTGIGSSLAKYLGGLSGTDLNTLASNFISSNPDIIPQSTFSGGGADMLDADIRALLGL